MMSPFGIGLTIGHPERPQTEQNMNIGDWMAWSSWDRSSDLYSPKCETIGLSPLIKTYWFIHTELARAAQVHSQGIWPIEIVKMYACWTHRQTISRNVWYTLLMNSAAPLSSSKGKKYNACWLSTSRRSKTPSERCKSKASSETHKKHRSYINRERIIV
jgi:hypothetical protein